MKERDLVIYGALFHDIGKVLQRVKGTRREAHPKISGKIIDKLTENEELKFIVEHHHESAFKNEYAADRLKILAAIVCEADTLSSGERESVEKTEYSKSLQSIFNQVHLENRPACIPHFQKIAELSIDDYDFPVKENIKADYKDTWDKLYKDLEDLEEQSFDTVLSILKKYLWCIPSAYYKTVPDVSIYEHSRLAASIAVCMYDYYTKNQNIDFERMENSNSFIHKIIFQDDNVDKYLLVCGDITGIQNYIYNIAYKGAAKNLKGRSLFVQQLLDSIGQRVLEEFELPYCNLLYSSGGKFYSLVPLLTDAENRIDEIEKEIMEKMLEEFDLTLGIVISSVRLCDNDFKREKNKKCRIIDKWEEINKKLEIKKRQKYASLFTADFFEPKEPSGSTEQCFATGIDICNKEDIDSNKFDKKDVGELKFKERNISGKIIYQFDMKGEDDTNEKFLSEEQFNTMKAGFSVRKNADVILHDAKHNEKQGIKILNIDTVVFTEFENNDGFTFTKATVLNDAGAIGTKYDKSISQRFKFYGGPWAFDYKCNPYEYDTNNKDHEKYIIGPNQPGVLRMDVDNLGQIFKEGFKDNTSFSRIIQLSSMLDFFFAGLLNRVRKLKWDPVAGINEEKGKIEVEEIVQIIYSGGDDVCIVGTWYVLPDLAKWINDEFRKFVCDNKSFGISAGISLFPQKYPVFKAAKQAGEAEDKAKNFRDEKDAVCFLDTAMSWQDFEVVSNYVKKLYENIMIGRESKNDDVDGTENKKLSRGFVNWLHRIYEEFESSDKVLWSRWRWRAAYYLSRMGKQNKGFEDIIDDLASKLFRNDKTEQDFIYILYVIARWTELLTRTEVKK